MLTERIKWVDNPNAILYITERKKVTVKMLNSYEQGEQQCIQNRKKTQRN